MRTSFVTAILLASSSLAFAGSRTGGDSGGGGRLGSVSSGIDRATNSPSPPRGSSDSDSTRDHRSDDTSSTTDTSGDCCYSSYYDGTPRKPIVWPKIDVSADGFAGAQKVFESDGSLSLELSLVFNRKFRITGAVSHYFEQSMPEREVTMNVPSLTVGFRLGHTPTTQLWLEGGVAHVRTHDPAGSSAITGSQVGLRAEHRAGPDTYLVGTAGGMLFSDVQALTARAAVRFHHVEVGFRYVDFTVGPALYGPEIGIGF